MNITGRVVDNLRQNGQGLLDLFIRPKKHTTEIIKATKEDKLDQDHKVDVCQEDIGDKDSQHCMVKRAGRRAEILLHQLSVEESDEVRQQLATIGEALRIVPGDPFVGSGLKPVEIDILQSYYRLGSEGDRVTVQPLAMPPATNI